jgi:phosphoribosylamine-glycine ligase
MKYIFITYSGLSLPVAYKLQQEGREVIVGQIENIKDYVMEEEVKRASESEFNRERRIRLFKNMVKIQPAERVIENLRAAKNHSDHFIFFEENNLYRWADKVRDLDIHGNFPTKEDYLFEIDRDHAKEFVKKHYQKLYTPEVREFNKIEEAIEFLKDTTDIWVLKGKHDTAKTYVPTISDIELAKNQVIEMLNNFPQIYERLGFILELFIPSIIEMTPEKMYYDGVPIVTTMNFENKYFGSGNISIQTGCAEDLIFPTDMEDKINKMCFPPIIDEMAKQHKGLFIWDASILINKRDGKMYFGEFCSNRPGYNSFFTELALTNTVSNFFEKMARKENPFTMGTVATSVRIFNLNRDEETEQVADNMTVDYRPEIEKDLWLWDVRKNQRGKLVTVGSDWNLAVITGAGKSIDEAVAKMYKNVDSFAFVGAYYRSKDDYLSLNYSTSIINRLNYGLERGLYRLPFNVKVGEIQAK